MFSNYKIWPLIFSYKIKSHQNMTEKMEKKFATKFSEIKGELEAADYISFTTDGWKTKNGKKAFIRFES